MPSKRKSSQFSAQAVKQQQINQDLHQAAAFSVSAFDNDSSSGAASSCQYFAVVVQGVDAFRLRIWDTRTSTLAGEHVVPAGVKCTAVVWGTVGDQSVATDGKKKKRRRSGVNAEQQGQKVVAITLSNGEVQLYSLAHGQVIRTLSGAHTAAVSDFAFAGDGVQGYSGGMDGLAIEWDLRTGVEQGRFSADGKPIKKVRISHDGTRLLTAGHAIKLWDTTSREILKAYPGHASEVTRIQFSADDKICVSAADDDRHVSVWDTTAEGSSDHLATLTMDGAPTNIALSSGNQLLALTEEGVVYLWANAARRDTTTPAKKKKKQSSLARSAEGALRIVSSADDGKTVLPVLAATFSDEKVLIARGNVVKPAFERVEYLDEDGKLQEKIELSRKPVHSLLMDESASFAGQKQHHAYKEANDLLVLGAADLPVNSTSMMVDDDLFTENTALKEPTLEERLSAMSVTPAESKPRKSNRPPTATSLHQMLSQAIHTSDVQLLEQALQVHNSDMILATVRRLPPSHVVPLLDQLLLRLQRRPNRARQLVEWVRAVLLVHTGYLLSVPHLASNLSALYQTLDSRASVFQKLLRLSGRLDLVVTQMAMRNRSADGEVVQDEEALVVYDEDEEEDEEEEAETEALQSMDLDDEDLDVDVDVDQVRM